MARRNSRGDSTGEKKCSPRERDRRLEHRAARSKCEGLTVVMLVVGVGCVKVVVAIPCLVCRVGFVRW